MTYLYWVGLLILSWFITLLIGPFILPILKKLKVSQIVREEGPKSHKSKSGTPTIGGLIFIIPVILIPLLLISKTQELYLALISIILFGAIGFIDDYFKILRKNNLGLTSAQKLILQILIAFIIIVMGLSINPDIRNILIPFFGSEISLGNLYIPFALFVIVGTVNSVNLTDGLDGLASGISAIVITFFSLVAMYLNLESLSFLGATLIGSLIGFLRFNSKPAKVFMGDTGSLALGGFIATMAMLTNTFVFLLIAGGVFFIETLTVIIQTISYKTRKKRVFKMTPIHHHFELSGWSEIKIVLTFWFIACCLNIIALIAFFSI